MKVFHKKESQSYVNGRNNNISLQIKKSKVKSSVHQGHLATVWRRKRLDPEGQANMGWSPTHSSLTFSDEGCGIFKT